MAIDEYDDTTDDPQQGGGGGGLNILAGMFGNPYSTREAHDYSTRILDRAMGPGNAKEEGAILEDFQKGARETRAVLEQARAQIQARKYDKAKMWLALGQGLSSPTASGSHGETMANVASLLAPEVDAQSKFQDTQENDVNALNMQLAGLSSAQAARRLEILKARQQAEKGLQVESLRTLSKPLKNQLPTSKGQDAVDRAYSKEYVDFVQTGASDAAKALDELGMARDRLRGYRTDENGEQVPIDNSDPRWLTGPIIGNVPKWARDMVIPASSDVQEMVEYTVQRSLRPILGAQFTEREGEKLINRVYNPRLDHNVNAGRLDRLVEQLKRAYEQKQRAASYYEQHGTLSGYQGKTSWNMSEFMPADEKNQKPPAGPLDEGYERPAPFHVRKIPGNKTPPVGEGTAAPRRRVKFSDLPHSPGYGGAGAPPAQGYAEGGEVDAGGLVEVDLGNGNIVAVPEGATQEEILAQYGDLLKPGAQPQPELVDPNAQPAEPVVPPQAAVAQAPPAMRRNQNGVYDTIMNSGIMLGGTGLGALAAKYGLQGGQRLYDTLPGKRMTKPEGKIIKVLENENLTPADWLERVRQGQKQGVPVMPLDTGGPEMRGLAGQALAARSEETRPLHQELVDRQAGARGRVGDQINTALKPDPYFEKMDTLTDDLYKNAKPLYDAAYKNAKPIPYKTVASVLDNPLGQKAIRDALKLLQAEKIPIGKVDATGTVRSFSLQGLDGVHKALADMITAEEGDGFTKKFTNKGRILRGLQTKLLGAMDAASPDYSKARAQYAEDMANREALRSGREDFTKMDPVEIRKQFDGLNFTQKDAYRSGAAQRLMEMVKGPSSDVNAAGKIINSPEMAERVDALFENPKHAAIFRAAMEAEANMFDESKDTIRAGKNALTRAPGDKSIVQKAIDKAPALGMFSPRMWALKLLKDKPDISTKDAAEVIKMLKTQSKEGLTKLATSLGPKFGREAVRKRGRGKAAVLGAALGAMATYLLEKDDDNPEEQEDTATPEDAH